MTEPCLVSNDRTGTGRCRIGFDLTSLRFAVVGAGRLGASLALALRAEGLDLAGFTAASAAGRARAGRWLGSPAQPGLEALVSLEADVYLLTVPDMAVSQVAARLAPLLPLHRRAFVVHTSGATSVKALEDCRARGAHTLVFHPLQTFSDPQTGSKCFKGTAIAVTPSPGVEDPGGASEAMGFALARLLGARPFLLDDDKRALYHVAATIACNYFVTLEHQASALFVRSGLPTEDTLSFFLPLVRTTLENIEDKGTVKALTGPISRGDIDTLQGHLAALTSDAPELLPVYKRLGLATLDIIRARAELPENTIQTIADLLADAEGSEGVPS